MSIVEAINPSQSDGVSEGAEFATRTACTLLPLRNIGCGSKKAAPLQW